jgi:hypothetical protein
MSSAFVSSLAGPTHLRRTVAAVLSLMVLGALLAGCRNSRAGSDKASGASTTKSAIDAEAQEQAEKYWGSLLTKCAGTVYGKDNRQAVDQIYEFRDSSIRIKPRVLSDADTMNGIEWSGDANFDSKTSRVLTAKQWGAWRNGSILLNSQKMEKVNGQWKFGVSADARPPLRTFDCSELP